MKAKVFTERSTKDVVEKLGRQSNDWLAAEPAATPVIVERLTHPTFGWGQVIVSVWYEEG